MSADLRQHLGRTGEDLALAHLERLGYELVVRNHRTRWGEIDLVVHDGATLVFVEVKPGARAAAGGARGKPCTSASACRCGAWPPLTSPTCATARARSSCGSTRSAS